MTGENDSIIRVILADDHPLIRQALKNVLEKQADIKVIAEAGDGEEAVNLTQQLTPDVVIMDISMPKLNGLEATRQIKAHCPGVAVLSLTVHNDSEHILGILEAGAAGYLTKSVFDKEVVQAVQTVAAGEVVFSPVTLQQLLKHSIRSSSKPLPLASGDVMTVREMEILKLAASGMSNRDISLKLELSLRTVKGYLAEIFAKLKVSSRTEATITALKAGIISLNDLG
jgi:two-component system, NarL family, response regulator LiaR